MEQKADELQSQKRNAEWSRHINKTPRPLTNDEKKAAEAAFQGLPCNPEWSEAAQVVYEGITAAMIRVTPDALSVHHTDWEAEAVGKV